MVDELLPVVNALVAAVGAEAVDEGFEGLGVFDEMGVVVAEESGAGVEGKSDGDDAGGGELVPEGGRAVETSDAVGFGFGEDGFCGVELAEALPESGFEEFLAGLGGFGGEAEEGAAVLGEVFEVEGLRAFVGEGGEEVGFTDAGEAGENDEVDVWEEGFEVGH